MVKQDGGDDGDGDGSVFVPAETALLQVLAGQAAAALTRLDAEVSQKEGQKDVSLSWEHRAFVGC